jgi:hypothetical protein
MGLQVADVHQELEGCFEDFGNFEIIQFQVQWRGDEADDRGDGEACGSGVFGELAEDFDLCRFDADFFVGFTQGSSRWAGVGFFTAPAGETDLAGMIAQVGGALGEQDGQTAVT